MEFYVVDMQLVYNAIMGTPAQAAFEVVILILHKRVKFPTKKGIGMEVSNPKGMLDYLVRNKKTVLSTKINDSPTSVWAHLEMLKNIWRKYFH